ncbi:hypothetical protein, partial [Bradyrhizobium sp. Mp27]|uniref:hypothetical protein n=1 Tax=Bradyrhizobium sp. Mp27 TaxID=3042157 RepID=UPI00248C0D80
GAGELNVLKRHLQSTVLTLLDRNTSQREIHRLTGVDRPVGRSKSPGYGHLKLPHLMIAVSAAEQQ